MLTYLSIRNLAIIDSLKLEFNSGFSCLTGETGAGKSILIDALNLILGMRADLSLIRHGHDKCEVSAVFNIANNPAAKQWLIDNEIAEDSEEGEDSNVCIIRRQIQRNNNGKSLLNDEPISLKSLKSLGERLINIHSQHAHIALLSEKSQCQLLDNFAKTAPLLQQLNQHSKQFKELYQQRNQLTNTDNIGQQLQLLEFQLTEFQQLNPQPDEYPKLLALHTQLASSESCQQDCQQALNQLSEGDFNSTSLLNSTLKQLEQHSQTFPKLTSAQSLLLEALTLQEEAINDIRQVLDNMETDPQHFQEVDQRMQIWHDLTRKHRITPENLYQHYQQLQQQFDNLNHATQRISELDQQLNKISENWRQTATQLTTARTQAATQLQQAILEKLIQLEMPTANLTIQISTKPDDDDRQSLDPNGLDKITFLFSANKDQPPKELSKIASGGELSRVSLAIAVSIAATSQTIPTLIFDEVDVGIGGKTASTVGLLLKTLGQQHQVLSITHQAQVAAFGSTHLEITKKMSDGQTHTNVTNLNQQQRINEIARMISGKTLTDTTLQYAKDLINQAAYI